MKIGVLGTARDVEQYLPHLLLALDEIRGRCRAQQGEVVCCFFENDSKDGTATVLGAWAAQRENVTIISERGLVERLTMRTERLEYGRTRCLQYLRGRHSDCDRVLVLDMDAVCANLDVARVVEVIFGSFEGIAVKCANSPHYYDRWALRTKGMAPSCATSESTGFPDLYGECSSLVRHGIRGDRVASDGGSLQGNDPIEVLSCFNGLAVYRGGLLLQGAGSLCSYRGTLGAHEECEHVSLNECLSQHGKVLIDPTLKVNGTSRVTTSGSGLDLPISSRRVPSIPGLFSWGSDYTSRGTEQSVWPGFFSSRWDPEVSWVWVRAHSPNNLEGLRDIDYFAREIIPRLKAPLVLVTGDGDNTVPDDLGDAAKIILASPFVVAWLAQNCSRPGGKLVALPIGLDAALPNDTLVATPRPENGRVVMDAHLAGGYFRQHARVFRDEVHKAIADLPHVTAPVVRVTRPELHAMWRAADFVVCCEGNGMDTHRAWEVLCMNRVPVVRRTPMTESLYRGLPVLLVDDILSAVADSHGLLRQSKELPPSSEKCLLAGFWLGRAAGMGAATLWSNAAFSARSTCSSSPVVAHPRWKKSCHTMLIVCGVCSFLFLLLMALKRLKGRVAATTARWPSQQ